MADDEVSLEVRVSQALDEMANSIEVYTAMVKAERAIPKHTEAEKQASKIWVLKRLQKRAGVEEAWWLLTGRQYPYR